MISSTIGEEERGGGEEEEGGEGEGGGRGSHGKASAAKEEKEETEERGRGGGRTELPQTSLPAGGSGWSCGCGLTCGGISGVLTSRLTPQTIVVMSNSLNKGNAVHSVVKSVTLYKVNIIMYKHTSTCVQVLPADIMIMTEV